MCGIAGTIDPLTGLSAHMIRLLAVLSVRVGLFVLVAG